MVMSIARSDAQALVPEEVSDAMMTNIESESAALSMFKRVPISSNQVRMPVLAALPIAYFVTGDTGLKATSKASWENKYFNVEELAVIIPVPENVIDDSGFDMWASIQPLIENAIARALDAAVFFGANKPASWPVEITTGALGAANVVEQGTASAATGGIATDISNLMALLEAQCVEITAAVASTFMRGQVRNLRDTTGQPITSVSTNDYWGIPVTYPMRGLWPTGEDTAQAVIGDFTQSLLGVRKDISFKLLDQAVIQESNGDIAFNLAQQDMVAMRIVARYAWVVANPITYDQPDESLRYPFGVLRK